MPLVTFQCICAMRLASARHQFDEVPAESAVAVLRSKFRSHLEKNPDTQLTKSLRRANISTAEAADMAGDVFDSRWEFGGYSRVNS